MSRTRLAAVALAVLPSLVGCKGEPAPKYDRKVPTVEGSSVVVPKIFQERAGIKTAPVAVGEIVPRVEAVGSVAFDPFGYAAIGTRVRGVVRRVLRREGDSVQRGDALAEIDSAEIGQAQADIRIAEAKVEGAQIHTRREEDLLKRNLTTAREFEMARTELKESEALLAAARQRARAYGGSTAGMGVYVLRAPIAGQVVSVDVSVGQSVESNHTGLRVADLSRLWVQLHVFERELDTIHAGDPVDITPASAGNAPPIVGRVQHVSAVIAPDTRTAEVRIEVDNKDRALRVGQSVRAAMKAQGRAKSVLRVPLTAVVYVDGKPTVFVKEAEEKFAPRPVASGDADASNVEIKEGLTAGEVIAVEGVFALKSELFR